MAEKQPIGIPIVSGPRISYQIEGMPLSRRERKIVALFARGLTQPEASIRLGTAYETVRNQGDMEVDRRDFMTRLVNSLTGTRWNDDMIIPEEPAIEIPKATWDRMITVSRIDRTLGEFFTKEGQEVLPHELQGLMSIRIAEQSMLFTMQEAILPEYLMRVGPLVTKPPKTA